MKTPLSPLARLLALFALPLAPAIGGTVVWQDSIVMDAAADISNPAGATPLLAVYFRPADLPEDQMINGVTFTRWTGNIAGLMTSSLGGGGYDGGAEFFPGPTDDGDLTAMLRAHGNASGDPSTVTVTFEGLEPGAVYQVQLVGAADDRGCCAGRVYEPDDGAGGFETGKTVQRGLHQSVIGSFAATGVTQMIQLRSLGGVAGNPDPALSAVTLFQTATASDSDNDGLPNAWETQFGLNPSSPADALFDGDGDGLNNLAEFAAGTKPNDDDSDDDTLKDGVETKTGIWVGPTDTGTDPLKADTDGDTLPDGAENFSLADGSNPNAADSDGDFYSDSVEIAAGSNPKVADSIPDGGAAIVSLGTGTGSLLGMDLTDPEGDGEDAGGGRGTYFNWRNVTSGTAPAIFELEGAVSVFDNRVGGGTDKWCCAEGRQEITVEFPAPVELTHFTLSSSNDTPGRDPAVFGIFGSEDGITFTPVFEYSAAAGPWTQRDEVLKFTLSAPGASYRFIRYQATATSGAGVHALGEIEYFGTIEDSDGDGISDAYEFDNTLNSASNTDREEDPDGDGLSNYLEFVLGTQARTKDTDGDGLDDNIENNSGVWAGETNTGTSPLRVDTDGDGLEDDVENPEEAFVGAEQPGTDPNKRDSDGDRFFDGAEIAAGTHPVDASSVPVIIEVLGVGKSFLGTDLTDPEGDIDDSGGGQGVNTNWVNVDLNGAPVTFDGEGALNVFDDELGGTVNKWCCAGGDLALTVEFAEPVSLTHFTVSSSNDSPARDPNTWSISGSNDNVTYTPIAALDGTSGLWTARDQVIRFTLNEPSAAYKYIRYQVTATGGGEHALGEIEYFGTVAATDPGFVIEGITRNPGTGAITLTWASVPGETYRIKYSTDLASFPGDLGVDVPAAASPATATTHTFTDPAPNAPRRFFRIQRD